MRNTSPGMAFRRLLLTLASTAPLAGQAMAQPVPQLPPPVGTVFQRGLGGWCGTFPNSCSMDALLFRDRLDGSPFLRLEVGPQKGITTGWTVCDLSHDEAISYPLEKPQDHHEIGTAGMQQVETLMSKTDSQVDSQVELKRKFTAIVSALPQAARECVGRPGT